MLKIWIEQIKNKPDHYGTAYWRYSISGNILELSVQKQFLEHEDEFRKAVIYIGKVLQALSQKLTEEGYQHHVQSFPNLDDSTLIAAIRILSKSGVKSNPVKPNDAKIDAKVVAEKLERYARSNQLVLHKVDSSDLKDVVIPAPDANMNWYALCASHDNPFIWLRVGYWHESMNNLKDKLQSKLIVVTDTVICSNRLILSGSGNNRFVQLLLGIPKEVAAG